MESKPQPDAQAPINQPQPQQGNSPGSSQGNSSGGQNQENLPTGQMVFPVVVNRKYAEFSSDYYEESRLNVATNLFQVGLNKVKANEVFLYGIDIKEHFPVHPNEIKNPIMNRLKKNRDFKAKLQEFFEWYYISGILLFGKPKPEKDEESKQLTFHIESENKEQKIYFREKLPDNQEIESRYKPAQQSNELSCYSFIIKKRHCITEETTEEKTGFSQILRNFINVLMGKVLRKARYNKDTTTRKIFYYKEEDARNALFADNYATNEIHKYCFFSALKCVCDCYEGNKILFKISPFNASSKDIFLCFIFSIIEFSPILLNT